MVYKTNLHDKLITIHHIMADNVTPKYYIESSLKDKTLEMNIMYWD